MKKHLDGNVIGKPTDKRTDKRQRIYQHDGIPACFLKWGLNYLKRKRSFRAGISFPFLTGKLHHKTIPAQTENREMD
jgi:hypothetical protein